MRLIDEIPHCKKKEMKTASLKDTPAPAPVTGGSYTAVKEEILEKPMASKESSRNLDLSASGLMDFSAEYDST